MEDNTLMESLLMLLCGNVFYPLPRDSRYLMHMNQIMVIMMVVEMMAPCPLVGMVSSINPLSSVR